MRLCVLSTRHRVHRILPCIGPASCCPASSAPALPHIPLLCPALSCIILPCSAHAVCHTQQATIRVVSNHISACLSALCRTQAYQVTNDAVLKLPPFQLGTSASPQASPKSGLSQRIVPPDVKVLTMYGRIYCAHVNHQQQRLVLYRFFK